MLLLLLTQEKITAIKCIRILKKGQETFDPLVIEVILKAKEVH